MEFLAQLLSQFVYATNYEMLSDTVVSQIKQHVIDTLGCCYAGLPLASMEAMRHVVMIDGGQEQASAIGLQRAVPTMQAAFINGSLARALEFDDIFMPDLHPSGVIVPVALALGEWVQSTGKEFLTAIATGLELCCRLSAAAYDFDLKNSLFNQRGQDASSLCGSIAASAMAAKLLKLDADKIMHAIAISVSFASGVIESNRTGGTIKGLQSGWAAKAAIQAALLAQAGITGPKAALEGRLGFYQSFISGKFQSAKLTTDLGQEWLMSTIRFKPYPCNYYTHTGIDAALNLLRRNIDIDQIVSLHLGVASPMFRTIGEPLPLKQSPQDGYAAKFSAPYTIASALLGGTGLGLGINDFNDDLVKEPRRKELMVKTTVSIDEECNEIFPEHAASILTITLKEGREWVEKVMVNRGSPANPLSNQEIIIKFQDNAAGHLTVEEQKKLIENIFNIESLVRVNDLVALMQTDRQVCL